MIGSRFPRILIGASAISLMFAHGYSARAADFAPSLATPPGITLIKERTGGRRNAQASFRFGDERGLKLYARLDPSAPCDEKCGKGWSPLLVSRGALAFGD